MKSKKFTLQKYSGFAGVFLLMSNDAETQAVYTDIEPDIEIEFNGQTAGIDMDNNGSIDFAFLKTSGSYDFWNGSSTVWRFRRKIWAGPEIISNSIAGVSFTIGAGYGTYYFPYAIEFGNIINEVLSFQNWGLQTAAQGHFAITFIDSDTVWNGNGGYWAPDLSSEYIGVHFLGDDACKHYGWIRCTTADSTNRLIIHDYAYETKCETGIIAGDTIGDTTTEIIGINENNSLAAEIYSFNRTVYIKINEPNIDADLSIFNTDGVKIYQNSLTESFNSIPLEIPAGIYIIKVVFNNKIATKKLLLGN